VSEALPHPEWGLSPGVTRTSPSQPAFIARGSPTSHPYGGPRAERRSPYTSPSSFFSANFELSTLGEEPLDRDYIVHYSTLQFDQPPPANAVLAILAHELKHVRDYTEMDAAEVTEFGLWYVTSDVSAYERETDEHSLQLGCGEGLIEFREWLYEVVTDEVEAQKRVDYYTPEEIREWMDANP